MHGQLYLSEDAGHSWRHIRDGFPAEVPRNINTYRIAFAPDSRAWGAIEDELYRSGDGGRTWSKFWDAPDDIVMVATKPA